MIIPILMKNLACSSIPPWMIAASMPLGSLSGTGSCCVIKFDLLALSFSTGGGSCPGWIFWSCKASSCVTKLAIGSKDRVIQMRIICQHHIQRATVGDNWCCNFCIFKFETISRFLHTPEMLKVWQKRLRNLQLWQKQKQQHTTCPCCNLRRHHLGRSQRTY